MAVFVDLTAQLGNGQTAFTGSYFPNATNSFVATTAPLFPAPSYNTGSWPGLGNTWGATALLTASLATTSSFAEGHWWGIGYSWGTYHIASESIDRNTLVSNLNPFEDQGLAEGDWNPFPIPVPPPAPVLPPRDLTRYRKAYSFGRNQPVRIRLVKP